MQVPRLPRRLRYRWSDGGVETEYSADIPTPPPEIKTNIVQVAVPRQYPTSFVLYATYSSNGQTTIVNQIHSYSEAYFTQTFQAGNPGVRLYLNGTNAQGMLYQASTNFSFFVSGSAYITPGANLKPRCDLLVGSDRIMNPTLEAPCPTWRFTGGNCPEGSLDCGNCCLDCAAVKAGIEGITASVLPYSTWRKP